MTRRPAQEKEFREYAAELTRAENEGFVFHLEFNATETIAFIGNLQLALRHPENKGPTAKLCRKTIDAMIEVIELRYPILGKVARRGDDPNYDM